jgi:hypothetical protein
MSKDTALWGIPLVSPDPYQRFSTDPCRHNHHGNIESQKAWQQTLHGLNRCQREVFEVFRQAYPETRTPKEVAAQLDKPLHSVSGRMTGGKSLGILERTDEIRDGSRALVLSSEWAHHLGL